MKPFQLQQFTVQQSEKVFAVGTDGVLLGSLCNVKSAGKVLEIGAGTGLVALMIAQRNLHAKILSLDVAPASVELATTNFQNSPFHQRLKVVQQDFNNFETAEKFDLIVSNPPYFEKNSSVNHIEARQQRRLTFEELIRGSAKLLENSGILSVIIPFAAEGDFIRKCHDSGLFPIRKIKIFGLRNSAPIRWILEFQRAAKPCAITEFTIEDSPRKYSAEYIELTKDFHVFQK